MDWYISFHAFVYIWFKQTLSGCEHIYRCEIIDGRVSKISEVWALQRYVSELLGYFAIKHGDARHLPNEAIGVVT